MKIFKSLPAQPAHSQPRFVSPRKAFFVIFAFVFSATLSFLFTSHPEDSSATLAGFNPGNLINDYTMSNYTTMSEADIQAFLKSKNPCNDTDIAKASAYPHLQYHIENGHFVCMADERFSGTNVGYGETAAHIIWDVSQTYRINPQVLIVLLEKEQGLVTDTWPNVTYQYRTATGYGCPDTAPCDAQYYGLRNQLENAAGMFRKLLDGGGINNYPVGWHNIAYQANATWCGSASVYVENIATGILYTYTPYTPNAAALAAGYGKGDDCSAHGNRNFYNLFTDWFGSTQSGPDIAYQRVISDGTYTLASNLTYDTVLTATGSTNGANIEMSAQRDASSKWRITFDESDSSYTFINVASGLALDITAASTENRANIQTYTPNGTCAQKWHIATRGDGSYTFLSACSALMAMDVNAGSTAPGANVQIYLDNGTNAQKWRLIPERTIADGLYEITTSLNAGGLALDISGGTAKAGNGTNIQIYSSNQTYAQRWSVSFDPVSGTYSIINPITGLSLDVSGARSTNGTNVQVYASNNTCAQRWLILPSKAASGDYEIISACAGAALDVNAARGVSGTNVQVYQQNQTLAQSWHFATITTESIIPEGVYEIIPGTNDSAALDIAGGVDRAGNGTNVHIYEQNQTDAQKWQLTFNPEDDTYTIVNAVNTNLALDVSGASRQDAANVQVYASNGTCAQRWRITKAEGDYYTLISACSNKALDVAGAGTTNWTNVWQYTDNGTNAQKWRLVKL